MLKIGSQNRSMININRSMVGAPIVGQVGQVGFAGYKTRPGWVDGPDGPVRGHIRERLSANMSAPGGGGGGGSRSGFGAGGGNGKVETFNPINDDLSKGTVVEDWIPTDPRRQTYMFRMMYARGGIEGNIIDTINDLIWSDFDFTGIKEKDVLDTYNASKEATQLSSLFPFVTAEYLVTGRCAAQLVLDAERGIWQDLTILDIDYLTVKGVPRTGWMPKIDYLPSPDVIEWAKSKDPRDVDSRKGYPKVMLDQLSSSKPVPLDPATTIYLPRRQFYHDWYGTSYFVRNLMMWAFEKSLINATMTGHRRRSGPITQIAVGSDTWEATTDQIDGLVSNYIAAEEDSVNSVIGTRHDVSFNMIRGSLQEMWKWQDEFSFIQEYKQKMFGFSDQFLTGDANLDVTNAPTIFLERLKSLRRTITQEMVLNKFCRSLAKVHNFRHRSEAQLAHRIRINHEDDELIIPTVRFHRNLDMNVDQARADVLEKMEEKGLPVTASEWNTALGGGDLMERYRNAAQDLSLRFEVLYMQRIQAKLTSLRETIGESDKKEVDEEVAQMRRDLKQVTFNDDDTPWDLAKLDEAGRERARDMVDGAEEGKVSSSYIAPNTKKVVGTNSQDAAIMRMGDDPHSYNRKGHVG